MGNSFSHVCTRLVNENGQHRAQFDEISFINVTVHELDYQSSNTKKERKH